MLHDISRRAPWRSYHEWRSTPFVCNVTCSMMSLPMLRIKSSGSWWRWCDEKAHLSSYVSDSSFHGSNIFLVAFIFHLGEILIGNLARFLFPVIFILQFLWNYWKLEKIKSKKIEKKTYRISIWKLMIHQLVSQLVQCQRCFGWSFSYITGNWEDFDKKYVSRIMQNVIKIVKLCKRISSSIYENLFHNFSKFAKILKV